MKRTDLMGAQPVTISGGPHKPFFIRWHELPVYRAEFTFRVDENERAVQAMATAVCGALHASQIYGDPIPRRRLADLIKMSGFGLNCLSRRIPRKSFSEERS